MSTMVYNMDCMEGMKEYPDKYFDLAIVDPPYGSGLGEGGGCGGWFAPYRENAGGGNLQSKLPRKEEIQPRFTSWETQGNGVSRTGGRWAAKFGKKSFRGMCRLNKSILKNCFASHVIRSYGGGTTSVYHLQDAS